MSLVWQRAVSVVIIAGLAAFSAVAPISASPGAVTRPSAKAPTAVGPEMFKPPQKGSVSTASGETTQPGFQVTSVLQGLDHPIAFQFSPDGRIFVAEKSGLIKVFDSLTDTTPDIFADLRTEVHDYWDRGLEDMILDPQFPTRPYIYVFYVFDAPIGGTAPTWGVAGATTDSCPANVGATVDGCVVSSRLSRLTASGNFMTGTEDVLINDWCQQFPSHSGGGMAFGADGALYLTGGEGASFTTQDWGQFGGTPGSGISKNPCGDPPAGVGGDQVLPTAEGGSLRAQDLRTPGDPTTLDGSLIRVDPNTGGPMAGNPATGPDLNAQRIIAEGLRNPFRLTIRPGTNEVWVGDVGDIRWEEINRIPDPASSVRNLGWPCYEGAAIQPTWDFMNVNICEQLYQTPNAVTPPYITYQHNAPNIFPGDTCPTAGASISGLSFYGQGNYPVEYQNALFVADYTRKCIWVVPAGANGLPDASLGKTFVGDAGGPTDIKTGPNGDLFYIDYDNGMLKRVQFFSANQPPVASVTADVTNGPAPLTVHFDGSGSHDADGDALSYSWDLDGDGVYGDSTAVAPTYTYSLARTYHVSLRVTDPSNAFSVATVAITAGDTAPTPTIVTPTAQTKWVVGQMISFSGGATDPEEGTLPASDLTWALIIHHCATLDSCHTHDVESFVGVSSGSFLAPDHEYPSYLELTLTATDAAGLSTTTSARVDPSTFDFQLQSVPPGLSLGIGSAVNATPFTRTVIDHSDVSLIAPPTQTLGGATYQFVSWSDGGAATHAVTALAATTVTATYSQVVAPTIAADAFTRTVAGGWGTADTGGAYTVSTANAFAVTGSAGTMRAQPGQTRVATLAVSARDVDETFSVTTDQPPTGAGEYAYVIARRTAANTEYRLKVRLKADGSVLVQATKAVANVETPLGVETLVPGVTFAAGTPLHIHAQLIGASPTTIRMRAWTGATEPTSWPYVMTDATAELQAAGGVGLRAYLPTNASTPVTFSFDDLLVTDASVPPPPPPPPPPPDQIAADAFTRTVAGGWGTADTGGAYTVSTANVFAVTGTTGTMRAQPGQTRVATLAVSARDVDETFSVTTDQAATGTGLYAYAVARRIDASTEYRAFIRFAANGSIHVAAAAVTGGTEHIIGSPGQIAPAGTYAAGARYHVRLQVTGASPTTIRMRAWLDGTTEPTSWVYSVTDSTAALQVAGAISLRAYVSSTATSGAVTFSFDDLQVVATD